MIRFPKPHLPEFSKGEFSTPLIIDNVLSVIKEKAEEYICHFDIKKVV